MAAPLALPDPQAVPVATVRSVLIPLAVAKREELRRGGTDAIPSALELNRQLEAFRRYIQDRATRDLLAAEQRRTEVLIGHLLGPVDPGQRTDLEPSAHTEGSALRQVKKTPRYEFRRLAEHEALIEAWLTAERPTVSRVGLLAKLKRMEENAKLDAAELPDVRGGDFRQVLESVPDGSVTLILTDPPYTLRALPSYEALGAFARRVLRPGGSLLCYTGGATLLGAGAALSRHLRYWDTLALLHRHGGHRVPGRWVIAAHKHVLWFVRDFRMGRQYVSTVLRGSAPEKAHHEWAQGIEEVMPLIEKLTEPGELIVDPFAGSGSFGRAALRLGRRFLGADLHPASDRGQVAVAEAAG
jgi:DNA methylase